MGSIYSDRCLKSRHERNGTQTESYIFRMNNPPYNRTLYERNGIMEIVYRTENGVEIPQKEIDQIKKSGWKETAKTFFACIGIAATGMFLYGMTRDKNNPEQDLREE